MSGEIMHISNCSVLSRKSSGKKRGWGILFIWLLMNVYHHPGLESSEQVKVLTQSHLPGSKIKHIW